MAFRSLTPDTKYRSPWPPIEEYWSHQLLQRDKNRIYVMKVRRLCAICRYRCADGWLQDHSLAKTPVNCKRTPATLCATSSCGGKVSAIYRCTTPAFSEAHPKRTSSRGARVAA